MKFSFVIPVHNGFGLLHQLLWDITKNCSTPHEVLIMDNVSTEHKFQDGIDWWSTSHLLPIKHVRNEENLGFLRNSNKGLKMATGDIVCLISTDVRVYKDIVSHVIDSDFLGLWGGRFIGWDTGWNQFNGKIFPYIEGWLVGTDASIWKELDYFDERFSPNDFEDVDLSTKATKNGW